MHIYIMYIHILYFYKSSRVQNFIFFVLFVLYSFLKLFIFAKKRDINIFKKLSRI